MSYNSSILPDNPYIYYTCTESSGTVAHDTSGHGLNGKLSGVTSYTTLTPIPGESDTCLTFSAGGGVTFPSSVNVDTWSAATLEYLINLGQGWYMVQVAVDATSTVLYLNGAVASSSSTVSSSFVDSALDLAGSLLSGGSLAKVALYQYKMSAATAATHANLFLNQPIVVKPTVGKLTITLAGVDISNYVQEETIQAKDQMGQSQGMVAGGSSSSRAATAQFLTSLGPASAAIGAGTRITSPQLVRGGEVIIYDAGGNKIFGGYVGKLTDQTAKRQNFTLVECYDYWQELARYQVQKVYSGVSDIFMIRDLFTTYAPWVDLSALPTTGTYMFSAKSFKATTLQQVLGQIADVTGYSIWIDANRKAHYVFPTNGSTAPFSLSDTPDYVHSFQYVFDTSSAVVIDDTATINRATFFGGKQPAPAFTQDLSTQANGSNRLFVLAYYPRSLANGTITVISQNLNNGAALTVGYLLGRGTANQFKSQGGTADVLLNADGHTLYFDPGAAAPVNSGANSVTASYRYEYPMNIQLTDQKSFQFYGKYYDGVISDQTVFDAQTAVGRLRTLLDEQSKGLTTLKLSCWKGGLQSGMLLSVTSAQRGINNVAYQIQEVDLVPLGAGNFRYDITAGAWNFNLVDAVLASTQAAFNAGINVNDNNNGQEENAVAIEQMLENVTGTDTWSKQTRTWGHYYARTTAQHDGSDAYAGLFSVSS